MDALECPPPAMLTWRESRLSGSRISPISGDANSNTVMLQGTPVEVERDICRCMEAAKADGGFILSGAT